MENKWSDRNVEDSNVEQGECGLNYYALAIGLLLHRGFSVVRGLSGSRYR